MSLPIPLTLRARARKTRRLAIETLEHRLAPATLEGFLWKDSDADGAQNGEPVLPGRTVFLDTNGNRVLDAGEASQTTDANGAYSFTVPAGTYDIAQVLDAGWAQTRPRNGPIAPGSVAVADWKPIGPFGGDAVATAIKPGDPTTILAAVDSETTQGVGGLYRSTDGGSTWTELWFFKDTEVHAVAYAADGTAWAGTFTGLYKSADGGANWARVDIAAENYQTVFAIGKHPTDANTIVVGLNSGFGQQPSTVWKTTDGGANWTDQTPPNTYQRIPHAITFNPANPQQLFVAYGGGFGQQGIFYSPDGGSSWQDRSAGLPSGPIWDVEFSGTNVLLAGGHPFNGQAMGVYRSSDLGQNWTLLSAGWAEPYARSVAVDPGNSQVIIAGTERDGVYRSTDGGANWTPRVGGTEGTMVNDVRFNGAGKVLASAGAYGVLASTNGGASFTSSTAGITEFETTSVAVNPINSAEMVLTYAGLNTGGVLKSTDGGATWARQTVGGTKYRFAKYAPDGRVFVAAEAASATGAAGLYSPNGGGTWVSLGPSSAYIKALTFHPTEPDVLVAVGQTTGLRATVWRTTNGGGTWAQVYQAATTSTVINDVEWLGTSSVLIASQYDQGNQVPQTGGVLRSADGGLSWGFTGATQAGLPLRFQGNGVAVAPSNPNKVYLANGYAYQSGFTYVSNDQGQTWTSGATSSSVSGMGNPLVEAASDQIVYAHEFGGRIVRSTDGGATWGKFDGGLDNAPWFYGAFEMTEVGSRLVTSTLAGVYATPVYSSASGIYTRTVGPTDIISGNDFGSRPLPGEVGGLVWEDEDGNGQFLGEFGRRDQVVFLDLNTNTTLDVGEPTYKTLDGGAYRFTGLAPGSYTVRLQPQTDTVQTFPVNNGGYTVTLAASGVVTGRDFGFQYRPALFRGTKFNDLDGDGVKDAGEPGLRGWTMFLDLNANGAVDQYEPSAVSGVDGSYTLSARDAGSYIVSELPAPYWAQTSPGDGSSEYQGPTRFEPTYGSWADRDTSTPNVIDVWYDFRNWTRPGQPPTTYTNEITPAQQDVVRAALDRWEQATGGRLKFTRNTTAAPADIITIGTGDLAATGGVSGPFGVAGQGYSGNGGPGALTTGIVWMDFAETWDTVIGNNNQYPTIDYFSVALHEIGHAIGIAHAQGTPFGWPIVMAESLSREYTGLSVLDIDQVRSLYGGADSRGGFYLLRGERGVTRDNLDFGAKSTGTPPYADVFLDFGVTFSSTEPPGYGLVKYDTPYNPYTRYGWTAGTDRYGWHSGSNNPLLEDYVDTADSTFAADLPTGTYDVTVILGASGSSFDRMGVSLEGTQVADLTAPPGQTISNTYRVSVTDGQLTARFHDLGGNTPKVAINAMTVVNVPDGLTVVVNPSSFGEGAGANAATGTVTRTGSIAQEITVNLTSGDTTEATVPATVTIPANQATATFPVAAVEDIEIDFTQTVAISASATGLAGGSTNVSVTDNEIAGALNVTVNPSTFSEAAGANAATGTVTRTGPLGNPLTVTLASNDTTEATVPAAVTILANQASATFTVAAVNDALVDGTQTVAISASAPSYTGGSTNVSVTDNEVALFLTVAINPSTFSEGAGANAATGTVTRNGSLTSSLTVTLASSDTTEATVPTSVIIPAGSASKTFTVAAVNDQVIDGTQTPIITASRAGFTSGTATISVTDNDAPLVLTLSANPNSFSEGAGPNAAVGTVGRNGDLAFPLMVSLSSSDTSEATVPASVTIPAGSASVTFWIRAVEDLISDGTQAAVLTATAGQVNRSTTVSVTDNEPVVFTSKKFDFGTASSPVATGFTRVTSTTQFSTSQGFGWSAGTIGEMDRGGSASDENRDFNYTSDGTFSVNVQNGTYQVTVTIGDAAAARDKMQVYLEGMRVENNLYTQPGQFYRRTYLVQVQDGQLTLRLKDLGGQTSTAVINALEFNRVGN